MSLPDIYQRGLNAIGDKATAARIVGILEDHGWLTRVEGGGVVAGRRRDVWAIHGKEAGHERSSPSIRAGGQKRGFGGPQGYLKAARHP